MHGSARKEVSMRMLIALASLAAGTAFGAAPSTPSKTDQAFVTLAASSNIGQIKLGQLATRKGSTEEIRKFGQTMVDDHRKLDDKLHGIAGREGFTLPREPTAEVRAAHDHLATLSGTAFDDAFLAEVKKDHEQSIALYQDEAQHGNNPQLKGFAEASLPALKHHEEQAARPMKKL
jgi:putative membrane protein